MDGTSMALAHFQSALVAPTVLLYRHRALTMALVRREILDRYVGQMLGALWVVGHPLILVSVYIFIFQYVFKMRVGGTPDMPLDYTAYILSGLIPWLAFVETLGKGPGVMVANASLVKQVVFPIEILPIKTVMATFVTQGICTIILMAYVLITSGSLPWSYALLPLLWFAQFLAMAGTCFVLAAVGAYFRDLKEFVQVFNVVGMYLMPLAYLPEWVPEGMRPLLYLNPFSYMIWCYQDACYFGRFEHPWAWPVFALGALLTFACGFRLFYRLKIYFGSIL
jgi:lipopolysaccharide transport system permease protein